MAAALQETITSIARKLNLNQYLAQKAYEAYERIFDEKGSQRKPA